jgi:hypothetical protein
MVVHLRQPAAALAVGDTMLSRLQPSPTNANIFVDPHTPGIGLALSPAGTLTVTVQNLSFQLLCRDTILQLVPHHALQYQLRVEVTQRGQYEFAVEVVNGTDEADSPAVLQVIDLFCQKIDAIESNYPPDAQMRLETHEEFKFTTSLPRWRVDYEATIRTMAQRDALDALGSLLRHGNQNRNKAFNGWTIPLPLSNNNCTILWEGLSSGEIQIIEKGTPAEIRARRDAKALATRQLRQ